MNRIAKVVISRCPDNSITSENANGQKSLSTKSFFISLKGDFAEFVDGFLLALVNDVQILFRHLDTGVSEQRRNSHLYDTVPRIEDIEKYPSVKAFVDHCITGGFDYQKDPARLKDAIENAEKVYTRKDNGNPDIFSTEQYILGKEIFRFVNAELQKLRNKLG